MGYITKGNGISIHRETCPNIKNTEERLIEVYWNEKTTKKYNVELLIETNNKKNILMDIISKTTSNNISVLSINMLNENIRYKLTIQVEDKKTLDKFIKDLENIKTLKKVERLIK